MRIADMNWMQVETYLQHDDRTVLPIGSTEQHSYLSLATDSLLAERVALDAAEPLGLPVFPMHPDRQRPWRQRRRATRRAGVGRRPPRLPGEVP